MTQISNMFNELNIKTSLHNSVVNENKTKVSIAFENTTDNLANYVDIINYTYCEEKRRTSSSIIEYLKIKECNKNTRDLHYNYIIENYKTISINELIIKTNLTENQIKKVISNHKKGIHQTPRFTTNIDYDKFIKDNVINNGCVSIAILSICEIEPELVYDFTTRSENHSFVASSFVTHNCPAETPEGQSIGIVKNLSYLTHVTIPTSSAALRQYVIPFITKVEDIYNENRKPAELFTKVKVFVNGVWVGITDNKSYVHFR